MAALPDLSAPARQRAAATGTHDADPIGAGRETLAQNLAQKGGREQTSSDSTGRKTSRGKSPKTPENIGQDACSRAFRPTRPTGLEPVTCGLEDRCSIHLSYGR